MCGGGGVGVGGRLPPMAPCGLWREDVCRSVRCFPEHIMLEGETEARSRTERGPWPAPRSRMDLSPNLAGPPPQLSGGSRERVAPNGTAWAETSPPGADDTSITAGNPRKQHIMAAYSGQAPDGALVLPPAVKPKRKVKGSDLLKSSPLTSAYGSPMRTSTSVPTLVPLVSPHGRHDRMPPVLDHKQAWQSPNSSAPNNDSSTERVAPHCENAACRVSLAHTAQWGSLVAAGRHGVV